VNKIVEWYDVMGYELECEFCSVILTVAQPLSLLADRLGEGNEENIAQMFILTSTRRYA